MQRRVLLGVILVDGVACYQPPAATGEPPPAIQAAAATTLTAGGGSGVRISPRWILTAAHCVFGYDGRTRKELRTQVGGREIALSLVESGAFEPDRGLMADWALLEPVDGPDALEGIAIATLPTPDELAQITAAVTGGPPLAIWGITYPNPTVRNPPHPAAVEGKALVARGRMLTDDEYRRRVALAVHTGETFDETAVQPFPALPPGAMAIWDGSATAPRIVELYERYKRAGNPLWFHSADYSNGSSGGGFFNEATGHYLGLVPMGATPFERRTTYAGFGSMYRIDKICEQSRRLATLPGCAALIATAKVERKL
jgi:hypothetical protein